MSLNNKNVINNKYVHDKVSSKYNRRHFEIYNLYEQERLWNIIKDITKSFEKKNLNVLDFWSGTWNLTHFFLENNCNVTSLDVSKKSLEVLIKIYWEFKEKISIKEFDWWKIPFNDNTFDIVATYSVLHHVPNYLEAVEEMIRCLNKWWILFIDHEANKNKWNPPIELQEYYKLTNNILKKIKNIFISWEVFEFDFWRWVFIRKFINNRFRNEWDLHVFKDDHIEWELIKELLKNKWMEIIEEKDYLLFSSNISVDTYNKFKNKLNDTKFIIAKKI